MRILLDTHAFLWWITDDPQLSEHARAIIEDPENSLFLSAASAWEIAIKAGTGRLPLPDVPARFVLQQMAANAVEGLPILLEHALLVYELPPLHRDPFDRLLVAQSRSEKIPILTLDSQIAQYAVETIW